MFLFAYWINIFFQLCVNLEFYVETLEEGGGELCSIKN